MNIWQKLKKPIFIQAPMEDVTDTVFRQIIGMVGKPDIYFTEFTNTDGIIKGNSEYISQRLQYDLKKERPIIAQIWGKNPDHYFQTAKLLKKMGFDGIDINMGCPDRKVIKNGCCSALIKNHELAKSLYDATVKGANGLPVSIKTRIGFSKIQTEEWIGFLLSLNPAAITIHARTVSEMSKVPAHWEEIGKAVKIRNALGSKTKIIGNGDITTYNQGLEYIKTLKCDGVMIGRGMLHNPWIFNKNINLKDVSLRDKLALLLQHVMLFHTTWDKTKNFDLMKKFYKAYITEFEGATEMRAELYAIKTPEETIRKIKELLG